MPLAHATGRTPREEARAACPGPVQSAVRNFLFWRIDFFELPDALATLRLQRPLQDRSQPDIGAGEQ